MRKLPVFGYSNNGAHKTDYEWPTAEDMLKMPLDKQIKCVGFNYKKCD